jgi:hypothetical protein
LKFCFWKLPIPWSSRASSRHQVQLLSEQHVCFFSFQTMEWHDSLWGFIHWHFPQSFPIGYYITTSFYESSMKTFIKICGDCWISRNQ